MRAREQGRKNLRGRQEAMRGKGKGSVLERYQDGSNHEGKEAGGLPQTYRMSGGKEHSQSSG